MTRDDESLLAKFRVGEYPRAAGYDFHWVQKHEMGPNVLWLAEALGQVMPLKPGMRVLDMGCGTGLSSIFLAKEYGVQVWATDLWVQATDNYKRIREAGVEDSVFPIHAEARRLPFADQFFDAIVSFDSYHYFGTDVHYLEFYMLKLLKRGGQIGIVSPTSVTELPSERPAHLDDNWYWMNSIAWWERHWARCPGLEVERAELLPGGWELWVRWHEFLNLYGERNRAAEAGELDTLLADQGRYIGFVRMVGRRAEEQA
jgi:cyclopropane fatty-acyl-phospholipid synthase-like methyltransferase